MTPSLGIRSEKPQVNWRNFGIGCRFAKNSNISTVLITSKGEPTLFPDQITDYLAHLKPYDFPFIELQTNGIILSQKYEDYKTYLDKWYALGLTTIAVSLAHYDNKKNKKIFQPKNAYMEVTDLIKKLHSLGFTVRLSIVMIKGLIDNVDGIKSLVKFAKDNKVEQLTLRPVEQPQKSENSNVYKWVSRNRLEEYQLEKIRNFLKKKATELIRLMHGAIVYDLDGQNICLTNALTTSTNPEEVRQLIFFPDGHLRYDWQYPGAILL
jgi:molybdenum cofactor biosynthesis enzyme MoaA